MDLQVNAPATAEGLPTTSLVTQALAPVADDLKALSNHLITYIPQHSQTSRSVIKYVFEGGGKRIRPALYFFACRLFDYRGDHLYPIGAVCEYVHTASLLHDDVVDNSSLRRNKPTANRVWGDEASVLVGDLIYARASEMMAATGSLEIVETFARAIRYMSEGELLQLEHVFDAQIQEKDYLEIMRCKTAVLIAASCRAAAILADAPLAQRNALEEFGQAVGMAFQLVDDALDYLGSREIFGKPTLSDLREGKVTLPIILLREHLDQTRKQWLEDVLASETISDGTLADIASLIERHGTAERTIERARTYTDRAMQALQQFPESPARADLAKLAEYLVWRFN